MSINTDDAVEIKLDREQAFLLYATFCGDIIRTAAALQIPPSAVIRMADEDGWADKLRPLLELKKSTKPGDVERAINRAVLYVRAYKFSMFLAKLSHKLEAMSDEQIDAYLFTTKNKQGESVAGLNTRPLADLATAIEKNNAQMYHALNDTVTERGKRKEEGSEVSASEMTLAITQAFEKVRASNSPRAVAFDNTLVAAQEAEAAATRKKLISTPSPNDNDDH